MVQADDRSDPAQERWSALMDGEASAHEWRQALADWKDDGQARADWHAYHLIGDTLRSQELCSPAAHDAAFLAALRTRLAAEPVVLAPTPVGAAANVPVGGRRRLGWSGPAAVAAGFVAVAGVLVVLRMPGQGAAGPDGARLAGQAGSQQQVAATAPPVTGVVPVRAGLAPAGTDAVPLQIRDGQMIRDARLNQYLQAHRGQSNRAVVVLPSGEVMRVDTMPAAGQ